MAWMERRQDPLTEVPLADKEAQLQAVVDWLGLEWLNREEPHPVRELWKRRDWLATTELLTIGSGLLKLKSAGHQKNFREAAEDVKADDFGNRAGSLFEILGAAMFSHSKHPVTLPKVGQPGFDFVIHLPKEKQLRVSCKALVPSAKEIEFRKFARDLHTDFSKELVPGTGCIVQMFLLGKNEARKFDRLHVLDHLRQAGKQGFTPAEQAYNISGWAFRLDRLAPEPGYRFWAGAASHSFMAMSPFLGDEQKRFEDKIQNAVSNLKKHCSDVSEDVGNLIFIKIPESVSFDKAREWLKTSLDEDSEFVSSVLLIRSQVASEDSKASSSFVVHEFAFVDNPRAKFALGTYLDDGSKEGFKFEMEVPIGRVSGVETKLEIHKGSTMFSPTEAYVYFSGHHFYHTHFAGVSTEFKARQYPNISVSTFVTGLTPGEPMRMDFIFPRENELVLI